MKITSRQEAISNSLDHYFTGKPCKHGHISRRNVKYRACLECVRLKSASNYSTQANTEAQRSWQKKNKVKLNAYQREHYKNNRDRILKNKRAWQKANLDYIRYKSAYERAYRLKATPSWANLKAIRKFYKECPIGFHVDHIVPLKGKNVCGLHILDNLQYLTETENLKKSNNF